MQEPLQQEFLAEDPPTQLLPPSDQPLATPPQIEPLQADASANPTTNVPLQMTPAPSHSTAAPESPGIKKPQPKRSDNIQSVELQVDWFNFETRMRKVIYEVVDPMTKKQFLTFEGLEDMKKQLQMMESKNQEIKDRVERNIKKCQLLDIHERRIKELENEMIMVKGIARNENASVLEKIETISQRVKITQQEVNTLSRFDEKIKKVQQQILQVTDEYNETVTNRLKEVSAGFIKQVNDLDAKHREHHRELQEVLLKLDTLKDFTQRHDLRFSSLQTFVNDLRETFEDTRLMMAAGKIEDANETIEGKLRRQISQLEKQLSDFQRLQNEQDAELRKGLHSLTSNRLDQFIFQSQQEMFEKIFSVKNINFHGHHGSHKRSKGLSMTDFQLQIQSNYRQWREVQLARGRLDRVNIMMDDLSHLRKQSMAIQSSSIRERSESQHSGGLDTLQPPAIMEELSEEDLLKRQTDALLGPSKIRKSIDPENEEQRRQLMSLQLIDQQTVIAGAKDINYQNINLVNSEIKQDGELTPVQERKISDAKSHSDDQVSPQAEQQDEQEDLHKKSRRANNLASQDPDDSSYSSSSGSEDNRRSKKVRLPPFLQELTVDRLKTLIDSQTIHLLERLSDQETLTQQKLDSLEARLSHHPLLNMISKNRELIELIKTDVIKLKDDGNRVQMSQDIRRLDATLNLTKNDLYQQIYKMREFQDQLYIKGVEQDARLDQEVVKTKKRAEQMQQNFDCQVAELKRTQREIADSRDLIGAVGEAVCSIVELEAVASALEQQDEVDRKGWVSGIQQVNNNLESQQASGYNPSPVNFLGQPFKRQNLVYCRRVLVEGLILQQISVKEPFSSFIKQKLTVSQDAFRNRLVTKLTKIDSEFQFKLDQLAVELERQHRLANPIIPKEVQRIKDVLKITDDQQTKNLAKPSVSRNASNVLKNRTSIVPENVNLLQNQNGPRDHHQKLRLALNQSMIETSTNSIAMNLTHDEIHKLDSKFRRHDALKPLPNNPLDKLGMSVNVGNIEHLPRQMQPIRGPHMLLSKSNSQVPQGNRHVQLPHPPDSPGSKIPSTIYNSPANHRQLGEYQANYRAIEMRHADIILNQSHVIPTLQNVVNSAIRLSSMSDREEAALQRSSAGSKHLMIK